VGGTVEDADADNEAEYGRADQANQTYAQNILGGAVHCLLLVV
jgi:hypothetical protein